MWKPSTRAERTFWRITGHPWPVLALGLAAIAVGAAFLPSLTKDTTSDAFIAADNPAVEYRDKAKETFGLEDPFVVAVRRREPHGVFTPATLTLVDSLTREIQKVPNVDPDRVVSLATESNIFGTEDGMVVSKFFDPPPDTQERADAIRAAIAEFPLYQGTLVANDGTATLIVAELIDQGGAQETYDRILELVDRLPTPPDVELHVAGEGAISGYLGTYIDRDARRLNPITGLVITLVLFVCFRTMRGALLPNVVVLGTSAVAFGSMAASGTPFYVITNGLLAILIGMAVAEPVHILTRYYEIGATSPGASHREIIVRAMAEMWRPTTLTVYTTVAGFVALWLSGGMPPMQRFGLFGAIGITVGWLYNMLVLPAILVLMRFRPSPAIGGRETSDRYAAAMAALGRFAVGRPRLVLGLAAAVVVLGCVGASRLLIEESQIENFQKHEPIYRADQVINAVFDGSHYLDVVVETDEREGLFSPDRLRRIEALQRFGETLPGIGGSTSVVDYIKQMHRAVNENRPELYSIPDDPKLVAQLFLLYSASAEPTDFEEEIDQTYRTALVRFHLNTSRYRNNRDVVQRLERYLTAELDGDGMTGHLSGRVNVDHHWLKTIGSTHFWSEGWSVLMCWLLNAVLFGSAWAATFTLVPVVVSVLLVYAVMGFGGIWLGVGTSMFAAIATGLSVDFGIHVVERLRELLRDGGDLDECIGELFPGTGRALFFNFLALGLGFSVLLTSEVPPLVRFGGLVAVAMLAGFLSAVTVMPALAVVFRPHFLAGRASIPEPINFTRKAAAVLLFVVASVVAAVHVRADALPSGDEVMREVVARDEGRWLSRNIRLQLIDRRGAERIEETRSFRRYYGSEKRTILFYTHPTNVRDTAFLTYDYPEPDRDDDQWLYLPALRKVRRISASDRGDYFLGTDLTYEEIKKENKVELSDYRFQTTGREIVDGIDCLVVESVPVNEKIAEELGYSKVVSRVDPAIWMSRKVDYWDRSGNHLKTLHNQRIDQIDGIWTVLELYVENHKTGHKSRLTFSDNDYATEVKDEMFEQGRLIRGL